MSQTLIARIHDPARGAFCDTDKNGNAVAMPPQTWDPPNGVRHQNKTAQDLMPVGQRPRVQEADRRRSKMQEEVK